MFIWFIKAFFLINQVLACAVCFDIKDEARGAYYLSTIAMSIIPLFMIFGLAYFFYRHFKSQ